MAIKQAVDTKAKSVWRAPSVVRKRDIRYQYSYELLKNEESKDHKNLKANQNDHFYFANNNSENKGQSG